MSFIPSTLYLQNSANILQTNTKPVSFLFEVDGHDLCQTKPPLVEGADHYFSRERNESPSMFLMFALDCDCQINSLLFNINF